ncbi:hypothetical protein B0T14DRAFT_108838 [Immersiella caudata]|uniref:Uncharacterized protein n=1 Tax=Immersiella caudata TaxID=314043 RepID=A0AA39X3D9_9PEZI|nr:hypothetical protein B0T14DRAFT_108838 [Immersiella caudata]
MGKRLAPWARLALGVARVHKVLTQLAVTNKRIGRTLHLSLLLTKALVARSNTKFAAALITNRLTGPSRNSDNTGINSHRYRHHLHPSPDKATAGFLPVLQLVQPYLDLALSPWIFSLLSPSLAHAMASYASYSTSSSDISTPRSISPSSVGRSSQSSFASSNKRMSISSSRRISAANPMSSVDINTIEEAMRMANLDTLRGYQQKNYGQEVRQYATTEYISENQALGYQVLNEPMWNKGKLRRRLIIHSLFT